MKKLLGIFSIILLILISCSDNSNNANNNQDQEFSCEFDDSVVNGNRKLELTF